MSVRYYTIVLYLFLCRMNEMKRVYSRHIFYLNI